MIVITQPIVELASRQRELAAGREPPPVGKWNPAHCGEIDIRIARDGTWFHDGSPIARRELVRLLSTILRREPDGHCYLVTPAEKMRIAVEDAPFLVVLLPRIRVAALDHTLTDEEIGELRRRCIEAVERATGATLRA